MGSLGRSHAALSHFWHVAVAATAAMKAYSALLAIRANQKDVYSRTDPIEPATPASPTTPVGDRTEPIAQLRREEIQVDTSDLSTVLGSGGYGTLQRAGVSRWVALKWLTF